MKIKNRVFCCDNLKLLRQLPSSCINLIYGDILYGTGRNYGIYKDIKTNRETVKSFYVPRLEQMHRVLKHSGSIYLQMDWRIIHWIRCIMDSIFGEHNFRNSLVWEYGAGDVNAKNRFRRYHDDILFYAKSKNNIYNVERDRAGKKLKDYFYIPHFSQKIFQKRYFKEQDDYEVYYPNQKPKALLMKIIKVSSNKGELVADFFCSSGTTGIACKELDRQYLLCDCNKKAIGITRRRLKHVQRKTK